MIQEFRIDRFRLLFDLEPEAFMSDHNLLWYARNRQLPEPEVIHVMLRALQAGDCAVDAGANVGFFTVLMSKIVGERGSVHAFEPDKCNAAKLKKNLDINSCTNVVVYECALGETTALTSVFPVGGDNGQTSVFGEGEPIDVVGLERLDTFTPQMKSPTLLKMYIEGSEVAALQGCSYRFPYIVSEVNPKSLERAGTSPEFLMGLLRGRGYRPYALHPDGSMPSRIAGSQRIACTRENANVLFATHDNVETKLWPEVEL